MTNIFKQYLSVFLLFALPFIGKAQTTPCTPVINSLSTDAAVCAGQNIVLQVSASSPNSSTLSYAWYKNGAAVSGATTNQLAINSFSASDADVYYVKVTNTCATADNFKNSNNITLTLKDKPTVSLVSNQASVCEGSNYTISINANTNNGGTLTYQWKKAGVAIVGATASSLSLTNVASANAATYAVDVTNSCNTTTSSNFQLTVSQKPVITAQPVAPAAVCVGGSFSLTAGVSGETSGKWFKDGVDIGVSAKTLQITNAATLNDAGIYKYVATNACGDVSTNEVQVVIKQLPVINSVTGPSSACVGSTVTITASASAAGDNSFTYKWFLNNTQISTSNPLVIPNFQNTGTYSVEVTNTCGTTTSTSVNKNVTVQVITAPSIATISNQQACLNGSIQLTPVVTNLVGSTISYQWYKDGVAVTNQNNLQLNLQNIQANQAGNYYLSINNGCSNSYVSNSFSVQVTGSPVVNAVTGPTQALCANTTLTLTVDATNAQSYQWTKDNADISGATLASYVVNNANTSHSGVYRVRVTSSCGVSVVSSPISVTVNGLPSISNQPQSATVCVGQSPTFNVTASSNGSTSLLYQWKKDGVAITGATTSTYTVSNAAVGNGGVYTVEISNGCSLSPVASNSATLTVNQKPTITLQPADVSICLGDNLSLSATVLEASSVKWQKNNVDIGNITNSVSKTSVLNDAGRYTFLATNSCGETKSAEALVVIKQKPAINSITGPASICEGTSITLTSAVNGNGDDNLTYVWNRNDVAVGGETASSIIINNVNANSTGTYTIEAKNSCGITKSKDLNKNFIVQLVAKPTVLPSADKVVCLNQTVTETPTINDVGTGNYTYQWYFNGEKLPAQKAAQLSLTNIEYAQSGAYYLAVDNGCAPVSGPTFNITVSQVPTVTSLNIPETICVGSSLTMSVVAANTVSYEWIKNTTPIQGATTAEYTFSANLNSGGSYKVKLTNACGYSITSVSKNLIVHNIPTVSSTLTSETLCEGSSTTKTVIANSSFGTLTYEWRENNLPIPGATSNSYTFKNSTAGTTKSYTVIVTNGCGDASGGSFTITGAKKPTATISTTLAYNQKALKNTVCLGKDITFTVNENANGNTLSYQWYLDDQSIVNQTTSSFTKNAVQLTDAGSYKLQVTNTCGAVFSNAIEVAVNQAPVISINPVSASQCENNTFSLSGLAINPTGTVSDINYYWMFKGSNLAETSNKLDFSPLNLQHTGEYKLYAKNECGETPSASAILKVVSEPRVTMTTPLNQRVICSLPNSANKTLNLTVTADNTTEVPSVVWSTKDGQIVGPANLSSVTVAPVGQNATYRATVSNACKSIDREFIVVNEDNKPSVSSFTQAPDNKFCETETVTINVKTKSSGFETFLWKKSDGTNLPETYSESGGNGVYTKTSARLSDGGTYFVDITNACGSTIGVGPIEIVVNPKPVASFDYVNASSQCFLNNSFQFKSTSTNLAGNPTYAWDFGDGFQNSSQQNNAVHSYGGTGTFTVKLSITNDYACSSIYTRNVTVIASPKITKQPLPSTVCEGAEYTLRAEVDLGGSPDVYYQWYFEGNPIPGGTSTNYKISSMSVANQGLYKLVAKNLACGGGDAISSEAKVTFQAKPVASFTVSKQLVGCLSDASYTFTNTTTPNLPETQYTWNISNGYSSSIKDLTYEFPATGEYLVSLVANARGCSTTAYIENSDTKKIVINDKPQIKENLPSLVVVNKGRPIDLKVVVNSPNAAGDELTPTYSWVKMPSTNLSNYTFNSISIASAVVSDSGRYYVNVSNACGVVKSNVAKVRVDDLPIVIKQPQATTVCFGKTLTLTTEGLSTDGNTPNYQWYFRKDLDTDPVPKTASPSLIIDNVTDANIGYYYAVLTNAVGETRTEQVFVGQERVPSINNIVSSPSLENGICANSTLTLTASVTTLTNAGYSLTWQVNGVAVENQTNTQLVIQSVDNRHNGTITLIAKNTCGETKSDLAVKVINAPEIIENPSSVSSCLGGDVNFKAKIAPSSLIPFAFEWKKIGSNAPINGISSQDQLILNSVQVADEGYYALQTSNICGIRTSASGKLTVVATAPIISQQPASISSCSGTVQSVNVIASSDGSSLSYAWYKNGNAINDQIGYKIDFASLKASDAGSYKVVVTNACNLSTSSNISQVVVKEKITLTQPILDRQICAGSNLDVNIENNISGAEPSTSYKWKLNSIDINDPSAFTNRIQLSSVTESKNGQYTVSATNSCGTSTLSLFTVKVMSVPLITKQPLTAAVCEGSNFTNTIEIANPDQIPVSYQWLLGGEIITNATNQQLSLQNIGSDNIGLYAVRISNICGVAQSNSARLSLVGNPVITQSPSTINACAGTEASSTILATSDDNQLKYAWYKNDVLLPGQTTNKLSFNRIVTSDAGTYKAVITNGCNLSTSSQATLVYVKDRISLINRLTDAERCVGTSLTADLTSNLNYADVSSIYQWKLNGVDYVNATATSKKLVINSLTTADGGQYAVVATNSCGSSSLNVLNLKIAVLPEITKQPLTATVCAGSNFTNNVEVANPTQTSLAYQWFLDGSAVNNAATSQLSLQNVSSANLGLYAVRVTNLCGSTLSSSARLSFVTNPEIIQNPSDINECSGVDAGTTVIATSNDNLLKYSWYKNDALLPSQNTNRLSFARLSSTDAGNYKSVVTNSCNLTISSTTIKVLVREKIDVINKIQDAEKCVGTDFSIDVSNNLKNADVDALYQWKLNGVDFVNTSATSKKLVINTLVPMHSGQYNLVATNSCGAADIPMFKLAVVTLPIISGQPISGEVCEKGSWTSTVTLANPNQSSVSYQWYKDAAVLVNGTNADFTLNNVTAVNAGIYYVKVTSVCGSVTSDRVGLSIKARPRLAINLVSTPPVQCLDNNRFEFSADARINDNTPIDLTWDFGDGVYSKRVADGHTYKIADNFKVYLFGKAQNGCLDTAMQSITVNNKPTIITDLAAQAVCKDAQMTYTIDVRQLPNEVVGYQWYFNQALLTKETAKTLTVNKFSESNKGFYSVRISNACGTTYSNEVKVDLADKPLFLSTLPIDKKVCEGESIVLKPGVFSYSPVTYQWLKNDLPMPGRTLDSLVIKGFVLSDVAKYGVRADNVCGTTTLANGNLLIKNVPFTPQGVVTDTLCYATGRVLKIDPIRNNDDTIRISWYLNDRMLQSGTNNQLTLTNFNSFQTGLYKVILSNSCGNVDVPIANLAVNRIKPGFKLDTLDACSEKLRITVTDTSKGFFPMAQHYWDIQETGVQLPGKPTTTYQFVNPGRFTIRHAVVDERGCISDTMFTRTVNYEKPHAVFSIVNNCLNTGSIPVDSSYFGIGSSKLVKYVWNYGDTVITTNRAVMPNYIFKTPGAKQLKLTVSSDSSCVTDSLVKTFMVYGKPVAAFESKDSCQGFPVLFTNRSVTSFAPDSVTSYIWNFDDGSTSTARDPQHIFTQYGAYRVRLTAISSNCPNLTDDTLVNLSIKSPRANMTYPLVQGVKGVVGQLAAASGGRSYSWSPFTGLSDSRIQKPTYKLSDSKVKYTITIVDSAGCVYKDQQEVWAFEKPDIYIATGFSPNNDGINDTYIPEYIQIKYLEYFRIADKNNRQIFITNDMKARWDGTFQGSPLPPDPFVVTVSGIDIYGNRITKQGIVVLVR